MTGVTLMCFTTSKSIKVNHLETTSYLTLFFLQHILSTLLIDHNAPFLYIKQTIFIPTVFEKRT